MSIVEGRRAGLTELLGGVSLAHDRLPKEDYFASRRMPPLTAAEKTLPRHSTDCKPALACRIRQVHAVVGIHIHFSRNGAREKAGVGSGVSQHVPGHHLAASDLPPQLKQGISASGSRNSSLRRGVSRLMGTSHCFAENATRDYSAWE